MGQRLWLWLWLLRLMVLGNGRAWWRTLLSHWPLHRELWLRWWMMELGMLL
jgi:hypothetical protein